ncbi:MAG: DNA topoisomerase 3 [Oscillospiraceae bacterium]|nr:DNA topoisomerase 3 [Oscillospiraceae bacterium]
MILVIAEKPSVARDIARVIGANEKSAGCITGNGYIVTWALGHLVTLQEPSELDARYKRWVASDLPILPDVIPLKVLPHGQEQYNIIKKHMMSRQVERLICATDAGREGELIFRYIYQYAGCKKPAQRLWISSMTDEAIRDGFARLRPSSAYDDLYESARARSEADWLVGMNASRAYSLRYDARLTVGRVQTPTLALLVKRKQEIDEFKPKKFWVVTADFGDFTGVPDTTAVLSGWYTGQWFDPQDPKKHIESAELANKIATEVQGRQARVKSVDKQKKSEIAPQLYDLTTLQRDANRLYGMTAQQTLDAVQSLYEKYKLVTYPRTDSRYLSNDIAPKLPNALQAVPHDLERYARELASKPILKTRRVFDDAKVSDHHAIIPTGNKQTSALPERERKVYDMIARRLVAAFMPEYRYEQTTVITECNGHLFKTQGKITLAEGWKAVYKNKNASKTGLCLEEYKNRNDEEQVLPPLNEGDTRTVRDVKIKEDTTKPPPKLTDATLLSAMENAGQKIDDDELREAMKKGGLGTPATRAAILERLIEVGYAKREGKSIVATDKGVKLVSVAPPILTDPILTGKWERALAQIADGAMNPARFRLAARKLAASVVAQATSATAAVVFPRESYAKKPAARKVPYKRKP